MYFSCFLPEKIPATLKLCLISDFPLSVSIKSRPMISFNFRLFLLAKSSCTSILSLSLFPICLPFLRLKTPLVNRVFLLVSLVASSAKRFLNSSGRSLLSTCCFPSTTLIFTGLASPSYIGTISLISPILFIDLNWSRSKYPSPFLLIDRDELEDLYRDSSSLSLDFITLRHEYRHERTSAKITNTISVLFLFLVTYAIAFLIISPLAPF